MEKFDIEKFPTSDAAKRMIGYVSEEFYKRSYVGKWLYQVMGQEWDHAQNIFEEIPLQFFPETATWGLAYHEMTWGLPIRKHLAAEKRRELIFQKRDCLVPMTPYRMERYLEDATGLEVHIADANDSGAYGFEAPHPNMFQIYLFGDGKADVGEVEKIINGIKQSHTTYAVGIVQVVCQELCVGVGQHRQYKPAAIIEEGMQPVGRRNEYATTF